jgi:two-component system OmpR family response regulator
MVTGLINAGGPASAEACVRNRILVADDDSDVVQLLAVSLKFVGFDVDTAADGSEALSRAREARPDAVLLELAMSGMDGLTVLERLREAGVEAPILFVTGCDAMEDKIRALTAGADDYITKPFHIEEVVARLKVVLRRTNPAGEEEANRRARRLSYADLVLDENSQEVWKADDLITLSPTEFKLLRYFVINAETVLSKKSIVSHLWPERPNSHGNAVESYVSLLRRKVDRGEKPLLLTLRGRGYILRTGSGRRGQSGKAS